MTHTTTASARTSRARRAASEHGEEHGHEPRDKATGKKTHGGQIRLPRPHRPTQNRTRHGARDTKQDKTGTATQSAATPRRGRGKQTRGAMRRTPTPRPRYTGKQSEERIEEKGRPARRDDTQTEERHDRSRHKQTEARGRSLRPRYHRGGAGKQPRKGTHGQRDAPIIDSRRHPARYRDRGSKQGRREADTGRDDKPPRNEQPRGTGPQATSHTRR